MKLLIALIISSTLVGCGEYKCVDGKMAYKQGSAWVIPPTAYDCKEIK